MADIIRTRVFHARPQSATAGTKRNAFNYSIFYLALPLSEMKAGIKRVLFSLNRFNLFSFYDKDHGDGRKSPESWIRDALDSCGIAEADGDVTLITLPRVFSYFFNPVSFWLCYDRQHTLRAVLAEVNNTFGERHCYMCAHPDRRPIEPQDWLQTEKTFHVSPFMTVEGHYRFRFQFDAEKLAIWINYHHANGDLALSTSMMGPRAALTSPRLLFYFLRYPLVTLQVIALIHYQAVKLFLKGVRFGPKPPPPELEISQ